jgi:hypothetical protein
MKSELELLKSENAKLKKALKFYADRKKWRHSAYWDKELNLQIVQGPLIFAYEYMIAEAALSAVSSKVKGD